MEKVPVQLDKNSQVRRARRLKVLFVAVLFVLAILAGLIGFLRKKQFQVTDIRIAGAQALDEGLVRSEVVKFLDGNYFLVIPKTNALLISKGGLRSYLMAQIPSLENARVDFTGTSSIVVTVAEKKPKYVWCREDQCYFVDQDGMVYAESPTFSDGVFLKFTGGGIAEGSPLRKRFVDTSQFMDTLAIVGILKQFPMDVVGVDYGADVSIRVSSINGTGVGQHSAIMVANGATPESVAQSVGLVVNDKVFAASLAGKGEKLEYIDLRFPGKIYYKFSQ